jgi:HAD superfamily hydrolase (TIGR01549 family)
VPHRALRPELVLFDMDDTLFDHSLTCRAALAVVRQEEPLLARLSLDILWKEYLRLLDAPGAPISARPSVYAALRAERFQTLGHLAGAAMDADHARELSIRYRENYQRLRRSVPGAVELLHRIARDHRVGIITNNEHREQTEKLEFLGIRDLIDPLVVSAREKVAKPDPRIFQIALERAGVTPGESVMVGDSWRNDVLGARAVGIRPVWFNRFGLAPPTRHRVESLRSFRPGGQAAVTIRGRTTA